jgi:YVTN family beta-propeller protein
MGISPSKLLVLLISVIAGGASSARAADAYRLVATVPLGSPDRWDYVVPDPTSRRVYVAHGDRLAVIDAANNRLIGNVAGISGGTHGTALSAATGQGFTDDGRNGRVIAFDPKTLAISRTIAAGDDADAIAADPRTGHIFVVEGHPGTITVIDPATDAVIATISGGEKMEYAVADGAGAIFVAGVDRGDILKIDATSNRVVARWPTVGCSDPHGLAYDGAHRRLFMGCSNSVMMVVDAVDGHAVATLPIGRGSDAIVFDGVRKRVFSANGKDGTISVYARTGADRYAPLPSIRTPVSGRTMAVDPTSGHLFVAAADTVVDPTPGARPHVVPGTLRLLVFAPTN